MDVRVDDALNRHVGLTLRVGLYAGLGVMIVGMVLSGVRGTKLAVHVIPLDRLGVGLAGGDSGAVLDAGLLVLFCTPLVGVLVALVDFTRQRQMQFVAVTVMLLVFVGVGLGVALR